MIKVYLFFGLSAAVFFAALTFWVSGSVMLAVLAYICGGILSVVVAVIWQVLPKRPRPYKQAETQEDTQSVYRF